MPSLSVADLVADPTLDTRVVAGAAGLDRVVLWAHSCEMPDPHRWLGPGELLMTIGLCVPSGSAAQRDFVARLADAGLAGVAIGDRLTSRRYTKALFAEADRRRFPVLHTGPETPFAAIGRTVAAANADHQAGHVLLLSRLYQVAATQDAEQRRSGRGVSTVLGTSLTVVDDATGCVVIGEGVLGDAGHRGNDVALRTPRPCHLRVGDGASVDAFTLVHLAQVLGVDATSVLQETVQRRERGTVVLEAWLADRHLVGTRQAITELWGTDKPAYRILAARPDTPERLQLALALTRRPLLVIESRGTVLCAFKEDDADEVRGVVAALGVLAGVSDRHRRLEDAGTATAQASSALNAADDGRRWCEFDGEGFPLLARSRREAQALVERVLGPLAVEDARTDMLRDTLFAFLDNDLRWQQTATRLGIHRQTLSYRLQQVEKLVGCDIRRTPDIAELWLARSAWATFESPALSIESRLG